MKKIIGIGIFLAGMAQAAFAGTIEIKDAWIRATPPSSKATAAYMLIMNKSDESLELVGAECAIAEKTRPMVTVTKHKDGQDISGMEYVNSFPIAANRTVVLAPGGDHMMLTGLRMTPVPGQKIKLVLYFRPGNQRVVVNAVVKK